MHDDLNAPLGQGQKVSRRVAFLPFLPRALAGVLALLLIGFALWAATANDPFGGEPSAFVVIDPAAVVKPAATAATTPAAEPAKVEVRPAGRPPGSTTVTIIDGTSGKREEVTIPGGATGSITPPPAASKSKARQ